MRRPDFLGNQRGVSLPLVLVALVVLSIVALLFTQKYTDMVRSQETLKVRQEARDLTRELVYMLNHRGLCSANFSGINVATNTPNRSTLIYRQFGPPIVDQVLLDEDGTKIENIYNNILKIRAIDIDNDFQQNAVAGPGAFRGMVSLRMVFESLRSVNGPNTLVRTIRLAVELKSDGSSEIQSCTAIGYSDSSPWTLMADGTLLYRQTTPVGIGLATNFSGAPTHRLQVDGEVLARNFLHRSDRRLKEHITENPGWSQLQRVQGVRFQWKKSSDSDSGVLAQNIREIYPHLVSGEETLSVQTLSLLAPLVQSTKALERRVAAQRNRFRKLEVALSKLLLKKERSRGALGFGNSQLPGGGVVVNPRSPR